MHTLYYPRNDDHIQSPGDQECASTVHSSVNSIVLSIKVSCTAMSTPWNWFDMIYWKLGRNKAFAQIDLDVRICVENPRPVGANTSRFNSAGLHILCIRLDSSYILMGLLFDKTAREIQSVRTIRATCFLQSAFLKICLCSGQSLRASTFLKSCVHLIC